MLILVSDSEVTIAQLLSVKAKILWSTEQEVLRELARTLLISGLVVRVLWVSPSLQPADPLSRLQGTFLGDKLRAERRLLGCPESWGWNARRGRV